MSKDNINRPLELALTLLTGQSISQNTWQTQHDITLRSVQRDATAIKTALSNTHYPAELKTQLHHDQVVYHIDQTSTLTAQTLLPLIKILLASRAFNQTELQTLLDTLLHQASQAEQQILKKVIANEAIAYQPVQHQQPLLPRLTQFSQWIATQTTINFTYQNAQNEIRHLNGLPLGIIFDTYYFYVLIHFQATEHHQERDAQYRLDRFQTITPSPTAIQPPRMQRLEEQKIRATNNLMQIGRTISVTFRFTGNPEVVFDKFSSASQLNTQPATFKLTQVNEQGFLMWALSQGERLTILAPESFKDRMIKTLQATLNNYS